MTTCCQVIDSNPFHKKVHKNSSLKIVCAGFSSFPADGFHEIFTDRLFFAAISDRSRILRATKKDFLQKFLSAKSLVTILPVCTTRLFPPRLLTVHFNYSPFG